MVVNTYLLFKRSWSKINTFVSIYLPSMLTVKIFYCLDASSDRANLAFKSALNSL